MRRRFKRTSRGVSLTCPAHIFKANPLIPANLKSEFTASGAIKDASIVAGILGEKWVRSKLSSLSFTPDMLKSGLANTVGMGLISTSLLSGVVSMLRPGLGRNVFMGGVVSMMTELANAYVVPMLPGMAGMGRGYMPFRAGSDDIMGGAFSQQEVVSVDDLSPTVNESVNW
jgi:hypothetical protein